MKIQKDTKLILDNYGVLMVRPNDYLAGGGEASVYRVSDLVIKLFTDPKKMDQDRMSDKISFLSGLNHPYIVAPRGLVKDGKGRGVGYYMEHIKGEPLSRIFTNDYRRMKGFDDKDALKLIKKMYECVQYVHSQNIIMVDANEMNWIVQKNSQGEVEPKVIDVDSWMFGSWLTTVVMPSIRDYHQNGFNEMSDWFSWAIVSFQVFTGIHPYKGRLDTYSLRDTEKRMRDNASVFSRGIKLNKAVRDFSCIPSDLLSWYEDVFQKGKRTIPPMSFGNIQKKKNVQIIQSSSQKLIFEKIFEKKNDKPIFIYPCGVVLFESGSLFDLDKKREIAKSDGEQCEVIRVEGGWIKADKKNKEFIFSFIKSTNLNTEMIEIKIKAHKFFRYQNRLFIITDAGLTELTVSNFGKVILSFGSSWRTMNNSCEWFDGMGVQDVLGASYLILPFGESSCGQIRVPELDGFKIVNAKAGDLFASIVALDKRGAYYRFDLCFDKGHHSYECDKYLVDSAEINMVILPKGVVAQISDDNDLEIFVPCSGEKKIIKDKNINIRMHLFSWENTVLYLLHDKVYSLKMR